MARLEIQNGEERLVIVTLSRRNLLALLQKLDMPGSARELHNNDCWEDGEQCDHPGTTLVLRCEDDLDHYAQRAAGPGIMVRETEEAILANGGIPGSVLYLGDSLTLVVDHPENIGRAPSEDS